ncbi:MAG: MoxR family ATPase [Planctomycetes bacterium]|nr:MoxR family ATPase [Planctomycetota bacterium]
MELAEIAENVTALRASIARAVVGQEQAVELLLVTLLADGHALLEGMPGTAKTLLARTFAGSLGLGFQRVQFTPDLMPGDVIGTNLFDFQSNTFRLTRGPVFTDVLLADEINRTPPKTQAALLQAMQERCVTIDGTTHPLGDGFFVVATQNPIEQEGTYPLPEAQLDRFLVKIRIGYPTREQELELARRHGHRAGLPDIQALGIRPLVDLDWLRAARAAVAGLRLADEIVAYVVDVVRATREHEALAAGASPRAIVMLCVASRALAALRGRDYVLPDDVQELAPPVLAHRVVLSPGAEIEGTTADGVLAEVLRAVAVPR